MAQLHLDNAGYIGCSYEDTQDPYWNYCALALPFGSSPTEYYAKTSKTVTNGGVSWTTDNPLFYGGSAYWDSAQSDYLTVDGDPEFYIQNKDWTIEFWIYNPTGTGSGVFSSYDDGGTTNPGFTWYGTSSATWVTLNTYVGSNGGGAPYVAATPDRWQHVAFSYTTTTGLCSCFGNGRLERYVSVNRELNIVNATSAKITFGYYRGGNSTYFKGRLQDFRLYNGVAKYADEFTPSQRSLVSTARRYPSGVYVVS